MHDRAHGAQTEHDTKMAVSVEMPKLGNTVEECLISRWLKKKGDSVAVDEPVVEIETDKTNFEVTAPVAGTLLESFYDEGAIVPVFSTLFVIGEPGESTESFRPGPNVNLVSSAPCEPASGRSETGTAKPSVVAINQDTSSQPTFPLSPRARRFAADHNFHPEGVRGTGPGGRVLEDDLRTHYHASSRLSGADINESDRSVAAVGQDVPPLSGEIETRISSIREKIARRMRESLCNTAQYTLNSSAYAGGLLLLRARLKASVGAPDVNINDMVMYCTVKALLDMPELNAQFIDGRICTGQEVHLGFACDTPRGLLVPVVRNAQALALAALAQRVKELSKQAVEGKIAVDDLSGATFTVSNLGNLGIESFTPLLNPPQVAILGVGAIQLKPVRRNGMVEFIDSIGLSLTVDHQIIDGAPGARFLKVVRKKIEAVEQLCMI